MNPDTGWDLIIVGGAGAVVLLVVSECRSPTPFATRSTRDRCGGTSATRAGAGDPKILDDFFYKPHGAGARRGGFASVFIFLPAVYQPAQPDEQIQPQF
jgi:hypothetical protein